jgi:hypothetical protein
MSGVGILLGAEARIKDVDVSSCGDGTVVGAHSVIVGNRIVRTLYAACASPDRTRCSSTMPLRRTDSVAAPA